MLAFLMLSACAYVAPCEDTACTAPVAEGIIGTTFAAGDTIVLPGPGAFHNGPVLVRIETPQTATTLCTRAMGIPAFACTFLRVPEHGDEAQVDPRDIAAYCRVVGGQEAGGRCHYIRTEETDRAVASIRDFIVLPHGYSAVVVTPPWQHAVEHELRHAREGVDH